MQEPFHVGLGPQSMHLGIICNPGVNKDFATRHFPKFWADKHGEGGMLVGQPAHPQHVNILKHLYMLGVDAETIPCGSGAFTNPHPVKICCPAVN